MCRFFITKVIIVNFSALAIFETRFCDIGESGTNGHLKRFQGHEELKNIG